MLLLAAGCSSDKDPNASAVSEDDAGPLSAYFEAFMGDMEDQDWSEMGRRSEEVVAACMIEQGFEYKQQDMSDMNESIEENEGDADAYGSEAYAAENGYGMFTSFDSSKDDGDGEQEWVDPNADYVAGMSEEEQAAYYAALHGEQPEVAEGDMLESGDWTTQGCQGKASHEVYEEGQIWGDPEFESLQEEMTALYERAQSDPEVAEVNQKWATCVSDAGFADFARPDEAISSISDEFNTLMSGTTEEAPEPDPTTVAEFKKKEIALAVADARCKKSTDYDGSVRKVQFALEQEFVDQHKAELDAWAEKYSTAAGK
jgi:hypothetical protein